MIILDKKVIMFKKLEYNECPVCKSDNINFLYKKYDDRYWYNDLFDIYMCEMCWCSFIKNPIDIKSLSYLYEDFYYSNNYTNIEKDKISNISKLIDNLWLRKIYNYVIGNICLWYFIKKKWKVLDYWCANDLNAKIAGLEYNEWVWMDVNRKLVDKLTSQWYKCYYWTLDEIDQIT